METLDIKRKVLQDNEQVAQQLRDRFALRPTLTINLISSPGSGKTSLLENTVARLQNDYQLAVLVGDIATERDAQRLARLGIPAHQILTGGACHLDSRQIKKGLEEAEFPDLDLLLIENVGNLICPTSYDLGEDFKVALLSIPEGEDKPFKYPAIFARSAVTVLTKIDLLPHTDFSLDAVRRQISCLNPQGRILITSVKTGEGLEEWCTLLGESLKRKRNCGTVTLGSQGNNV